MMISTFALTQKLRAYGNLPHVNAQALIVFRLRNRLELDAIIETLSDVYDKKTLMEMYQLATADPYSFWYVNLATSKTSQMFWLRLEQQIVPGTPSSNALIR